MRLSSWFLRKLSNEDCRTDLLEYVLIASVITLGVVATCGAITERVAMEFSTIASRLSFSAVAR